MWPLACCSEASAAQARRWVGATKTSPSGVMPRPCLYSGFFGGTRYVFVMPEKNLNEIPRDVRELFQKGTVALQRQNFDYAIAIFTQIIQREPAFLEGRQALRAAQFKKAGGSTGFFKKVLGGASSSPLIAKAQVILRKNPIEAMQIA